MFRSLLSEYLPHVPLFRIGAALVPSTSCCCLVFVSLWSPHGRVVWAFSTSFHKVVSEKLGF